jgi:hypothetical protein
MKPNKKDKIPDHLVNKLKLTTAALGTETGRNLSVEFKGVFAFVFEDRAPLCRLKYIGKEGKWGFAIFKWSTETFSAGEFGFPLSGSIRQCIEVALNAYS